MNSAARLIPRCASRAAELLRHAAPRHANGLPRRTIDDQLEAVQFLIEREELQDPLGRVGVRGVAVEAERVPRALDVDRAIAARQDAVAFGGGGGVVGEVDRDRADVAVAAEGLEEHVGHDQVTVLVRVDAVLLTGQRVLRAELRLRLGHDRRHRVVYVGEDDALLGRDLPRDVALVGQDRVVLRRHLRPAPERLRVDDARRAQHDSRTPLALNARTMPRRLVRYRS